MFKRAGAFPILAIGSVALAVGVSTTAFSIIDAATHPRLPIDKERSVTVVRMAGAGADRAVSLEQQLAALRSLDEAKSVAVSVLAAERVYVNGDYRRVVVARVSRGLIDLLGIPLTSGHRPSSAEAESHEAVALTSRLWRVIGGGAELASAQLQVDRIRVTPIALLPPRAELVNNADVWRVYRDSGDFSRESDGTLLVDGKLFVQWNAPLEPLRVRALLELAAMRLRAAQPGGIAKSQLRFEIRPLTTPPPAVVDSQPFFAVLIAAVLIVGAANVAALSLARGLERGNDYAVRRALGATPFRVAVEIGREVLVLTALGTVVGGWLAAMAIGIASHAISEELTWRWVDVPVVSPRVIVFAAVALLVTTLIAAAIPVIRSLKQEPSAALGQRAALARPEGTFALGVVVVGEVVVAMGLTTLTGMLFDSVRHLTSRDFGFPVKEYVSATVGLVEYKQLTVQQRGQYRTQSVTMLAAEPGVRSAVAVSSEPAESQLATVRLGNGATRVAPLPAYSEVDPRFFSTLGVKLLSGRDFDDSDRGMGGAVILTRSAAMKYFGSLNVIGRELRLGGENSVRPWIPVIAVASDIDLRLQSEGDQQLFPAVFAVTNQAALRDWRVMLRIPTQSPQVLQLLRDRLRAGMASPILSIVEPWNADYQSTLDLQRLIANLSSLLCGLALFLAASGLFTLLLYSVRARQREFALRIALGASKRAIMSELGAMIARIILIGTGIGAGISVMSAAVIRNAVIGLEAPTGLVVLVGALAVAAISVVASYFPALRATRADPASLLNEL